MLNDQQVPNTLDPMVPPGEGGGPKFEVASFVESVGRIQKTQKISPKWLATGHKLYTFPNKLTARHLLPTINYSNSQKPSTCKTIMWLMVNFAVVSFFQKPLPEEPKPPPKAGCWNVGNPMGWRECHHLDIDETEDPRGGIIETDHQRSMF